MQVLAATDFSTRSNRAVGQAGLLAQFSRARLHVVHVVDDDQPEELVRMEKREAERVLAEQVDSMPELLGVACHPMVVIGDPFDGILRAASDVNADLIVMGTHRKQLLLDTFVGTTIERVVRSGSFPVLMVNNEAQRNTRILWRLLISRLLQRMRSKSRSNDLKDKRWSLRPEEGRPMEIISRTVSAMRPDLLVMGTHGRAGIIKALIGSVTEEALRSLSVDILAVPPSTK